MTKNAKKCFGTMAMVAVALVVYLFVGKTKTETVAQSKPEQVVLAQNAPQVAAEPVVEKSPFPTNTLKLTLRMVE